MCKLHIPPLLIRFAKHSPNKRIEEAEILWKHLNFPKKENFVFLSEPFWLWAVRKVNNEGPSNAVLVCGGHTTDVWTGKQTPHARTWSCWTTTCKPESLAGDRIIKQPAMSHPYWYFCSGNPELNNKNLISMCEESISKYFWDWFSFTKNVVCQWKQDSCPSGTIRLHCGLGPTQSPSLHQQRLSHTSACWCSRQSDWNTTQRPSRLPRWPFCKVLLPLWAQDVSPNKRQWESGNHRWIPIKAPKKKKTRGKGSSSFWVMGTKRRNYGIMRAEEIGASRQKLRKPPPPGWTGHQQLKKNSSISQKSIWPRPEVTAKLQGRWRDSLDKISLRKLFLCLLP